MEREAMSTIESPEYRSVCETVARWPAAQRHALVQEILAMRDREATRSETPAPRVSTLARAIGIGRGEGPPPTDEEVERWLDERRWEKYR
jgi:hypothetical protein